MRTAVDDQVLVLTTEYTRPQTITVTDEVSNYNLQTSVNVIYQTILHSNYKIMQSTFTQTVYSTLVHYLTRLLAFALKVINSKLVLHQFNNQFLPSSA